MRVVLLAFVRIYYIGLGSNLGDRHSNIMSALQALRRYVEVAAASSLYETEPIQVEGPRFLNAVARVESDADEAMLRAYLQRIETRLGRNERAGPAARPIDLDLLALDETLHEQTYYLTPLAELAPEVVIGAQGKTLFELAAAAQPASQRRNRAIRFEADRQSGCLKFPSRLTGLG